MSSWSRLLGLVLLLNATAVATEVGSGEGFTVEVPLILAPRPPVADEVKPGSRGPAGTFMPGPGDGGRSDGPGPLLRRNLSTGEVTVYDGDVLAGVDPSKRGSGVFAGLLASGGKWVEETLSNRGFGTMTPVFNQDQYPMSAVVKIFAHFTFDEDDEGWYTCSGLLVDAQTVLTAGHCIYFWGTDNGWADRVEIVPAYLEDDDGDTFGESDLFGEATIGTGADLWSWQGYTADSDLNWDLGVINLERPVGMLAGWHGVDSYGACADVVGELGLFNPSYPSEDCPINGLHTGNQMYTWSGVFDSCFEDNQVDIETGGGGCFDSGWGGMSGSSAYTIGDDGHRRSVAVASSSDRETYLRYAQLWPDAVDYIHDTIIPAGRGAEFDVNAMLAEASATDFVVGDSIPDLQLLLCNPTNAGSSDEWMFAIYLSEDREFDQGDALISVQWGDEPYVIPAMTNFTVNLVSPVIPETTPSGTNYVLIQALAPADVNDSNNVTDVWDAFPIQVDGYTEVGFTNYQVSSTPVEDGGEIQVDWTIENTGGDDTQRYLVLTYASTNEVISAEDTLISELLFFNIEGGGSQSHTDWITLPDGLAGDVSTDYWIGSQVWPYESAWSPATAVAPDPITVYVRPSNDACYSATPITDGDTAFDTSWATTDGQSHPGQCQFDGQIYHDIFHTYESPCNGELVVSTCSQADYDTDLAIYYHGGWCDEIVLLDCNDDTEGCLGFTSTVSASVTAGDRYLIRVGGYEAGSAGPGVLSVACEPTAWSADLDGDGDVDIEDLLALLAAYGSTDGGDINGDGLTDVEDLLLLLAAFGN